MKKGTKRPLELLRLCCRTLAEKKAEDIRVLDVSAQSSITDYLVIATGTSEPHLRALRIELTRVLADARTRLVGVETAQDSGWTVIDIFDVMIHLLSPESRERYRLEGLWRDAIDMPVPGLLAVRKARAKAKTRNRVRPRPAT
jgi:ribosome-associated protein